MAQELIYLTAEGYKKLKDELDHLRSVERPAASAAIAERKAAEEDNDASEVLCRIDFQEGPIKECGVNGVCNEDLINMVIARLEAFQETEFKCRENSIAITKLEEALLWLRKRTMAREQRGVVGTHEV